MLFMDRYFVFRNYTVELLFPRGYSFSGYDDISVIPMDADAFVWFSTIPVDPSPDSVKAKIFCYTQEFQFVLSKIDRDRLVIAVTMEPISFYKFQEIDHSVVSAIEAYNQALYDMEKACPNLKVVDFSGFTSQYDSKNLMDWKYFFVSQMALNPKLSKSFLGWWSLKLDSISQKRKKCLVLDLDNTLWGGILGEVGVEGIRVGGDYPGNAFSYFQRSLLQLMEQGVILAVCSKNNLRDVEEVWDKNPFQLLKKSHFSALRINWTDKATNIRSIADELNIGLDSMVFFDDNPSERELVRQALPMVEVPDFPEAPYDIPAFFKDCVEKYFTVYSLTEEDKRKTEQYKANAARNQAALSFDDYTKFLRSLDIKLKIMPIDEFNKGRIAQMTQKTNQFNLTTKRYTDVDLDRLSLEGAKIWCLSVADKFGDSGITGALIYLAGEIDTFLLSCRVLGKGIEKAFLKYVLGLLRENGVSSVRAVFSPTPKNAQVIDFYDKCGFRLEREEEGVRYYGIDLVDADLTIEDYYSII